MTDDKSLKEKAVDIKGKAYVLVSDRILYFNDKYPKGGITTELVSSPDSKIVVVQARVFPEGQNDLRCFTGFSQAVVGEGYINKTAALENAETSAVGRALAFMGIGVIESIASADEIHKASSTSPEAVKPPVAHPKRPNPPLAKSPAQRELAAKLRIAELVDKIKGEKPEATTKEEKAAYYGDAVQEYTKRSLELAHVDELEEIADELSKLAYPEN